MDTGKSIDRQEPRWMRDCGRYLGLKSQFVLTGNIKDRYLMASEDSNPVFLGLIPFLAESLWKKGYRYFLQFNPVEGIRLVVPSESDPEDAIRFWNSHLGLRLAADKQDQECSLAQALDWAERTAHIRDTALAWFWDCSSRLVADANHLSNQEHEWFRRAWMTGQRAQPHLSNSTPYPVFNSWFWLAEKETDLPEWLTVGNALVRSIPLPRPDSATRREVVRSLARHFSGASSLEGGNAAKWEDFFVESTDGLMVTDLIGITQLCRSEEIPSENITEAVRRYKLGVTEDPWKRIDRKKLSGGDAFIRRRVLGQEAAVMKSLDILKRAVTGLSGLSRWNGSQPRGVLFYAGPTGVGKTELAKTLTELLFGDEQAYIRFDMSEFSAEHADQRLLGAPPGYVGHDAGGELTNAIRQRPFSVVLFDEIEKAHPRLMDKFLQLLDDGTLTSGRGERVYFSEAVIVFTSNLGIYKKDALGERVLNVNPSDEYPVVVEKVRKEIDRYFKVDLNRPELLNRIGENIMVFDFIRPDVAKLIFDKMISQLSLRLRDQQQWELDWTESALEALLLFCTKDLSQGGRGIANQVEAYFVNPLARTLFDYDVPRGSLLTVTAVFPEADIPSVELSVTPPAT